MDKRFLWKNLKQLCLIFSFGFLGGCIYFNLLWHMRGSLFQNEWGMVLDYLSELPLLKNERMVFYLIMELPILFLVLVLGFFRMGKILFQGLIASFGVMTGGMESLLILSMKLQDGFGLLGKWLLVWMVPILVLGCEILLSVSMSLIRSSMTGKTEKWKRIQVKKYFFYSAWTIILCTIYIFLVGYVNFEKNIFFFHR